MQEEATTMRREDAAMHFGAYIIVMFLTASYASAAEYHVKQYGTGDFSAIQAAMDASVDGDKVIVHPGTYFENIHFNGKNITLRSTDPADWDVVEATVIDGGEKGSVVTFEGTEDETCVLSGFTITNGWTRGDESYYGGGIIGGSYESPHTRATISDCVITGNFGFEGGGIAFCDGRITDCVIRDNAPNWAGGGLFGCDGEIVRCTITGHNSFEHAGLVLCRATVRDCVIAGNSSAFANGGWEVILDNCLIVNNGDGIASASGQITNCTIADNNGPNGRAAILNFTGLIRNCVIWGNAPTRGEQLIECSQPSYCCIEAWACGEGNIPENPLFVAGTLGDYYLDPDSPCVDAGSMSADEAGLSDRTTRADGLPDTGIVDMGFHYPTMEDHVDVEVSCSLSADVFAPGYVLQGFMSVENRGVDVAADIFAAIAMPNGSTISLTHNGFAVGAWSWYSDLLLPSGFRAGPDLTLELVIPADAGTGSYSYLAAICRAGEGSSGVLSIDECPFQIYEPVVSNYYVDADLGDDGNDGSEDAPWKTITHALNFVEGSEANPVTIHVAAGTYSASTNGETFPLNMKTKVSLSGEDRETTVLNAEDMAYHVIYCDGVNDLTIAGFTITGTNSGGGIYCSCSSAWISNNTITGNKGSSGGGISCYESSPTITHNTIANNSAGWFGGGIYCSYSSAWISNNIISGNSAGYAGGGIDCVHSSPAIRNNTIVGNSAERRGGGIRCIWDSSATIIGNTIADNWTGEYGSGISCIESSPMISENTITGNKSAELGGGIHCYGSSPMISENTIGDNSSGWSGGGICCEYLSSPTIENNAIEGNSADDGGGIYCEQSSPTITSNTISGNTAFLGGGIYCYYESSPTITNNTITENSSNRFGGGICCEYLSSPTISNNAIERNSAERDGGGICCYYESRATISDNTITDNSSKRFGGGIYCWLCSLPMILSNTISGNSAGYAGGAISCWESSPRVSNNTIAGNSASLCGGIYCSQSSPTITDNTIVNNSGGDGAGIYCSQSSPMITNNTISGNTAGLGAGIYCYSSSPTISNNTIAHNSVTYFGSGIFCSRSSPTVTNNTIAGNTAGMEGGGIYCYLGSPTITDCIIWGNGDDLYQCEATFCCIEDNDWGPGNIHADPMFVPGPLGDYYLHPDSPCIDAGSQSADEAGLSGRTTRGDGVPDTGTVDMGYHYPVP